MLNPFDIHVYDSSFQLQRPITTLRSADVTPRHNGQGTAQIILASDNEANAALAAEGARVTIWARDEHQLSGWVDSDGGSILASGDIAYQIQGDECVLDETQAFVAPGSAIAPGTLSALGQAWQTGTAGPEGTSAGQTGYYVWPAEVASAESAIKDLIQKNLVARLGRPYTVATNLDRGGDARAAGVLPQVRFGTLREAIAPLLEWSGLGLRIWQEPGDTTITVDVYEPVEWPATLTPASGIVIDGKYSRTGPTATRVITGGPGDLQDRAFALYVDAPLEARFGRVIEVFKEATSAQLEWPDELADAYRVAKYYALRPDISSDLKAAFARDMKASADAELLDGRPAASLDIELTETEAFRFGGPAGIHLGDRVTIETAGGQEFTDHIDSATLAVGGDAGFTVKPSLGTGTDDEDEEVWRAIARLAAALRSMSTRK